MRARPVAAEEQGAYKPTDEEMATKARSSETRSGHVSLTFSSPGELGGKGAALKEADADPGSITLWLRDVRPLADPLHQGVDPLSACGDLAVKTH